jgi:hypothetical protein
MDREMDSHQDDSLSLIAFESIDGFPGIRAVRMLSPEEARQYREAVEHLVEFRDSRDLLPLVQGNFTELSQLGHALRTRAWAKVLEAAQKREVQMHVQRLLVNFLTSMRLFVDHTQTRLTRRYGTDSEQMLVFKGATGRAFDTFPEYRLCYKLRNYVQHCRMPVWVGQHSRLEGTESVHEVTIRCSPEQLLATYGEWGKVKADLAVAGEQIDLLNATRTALVALKEIDREVTDSERSVLLKSGGSIAELLLEVARGDTTAAVGAVKHKPPLTTLNLLLPPFELLHALGYRIKPPPV